MRNNPVSFSLGRSQSVGPVSSTIEGSPKRQIRSGSAVPTNTSAPKSGTTGTTLTAGQKKTPVTTPTIVERRPRPSKYTKFKSKTYLKKWCELKEDNSFIFTT